MPQRRAAAKLCSLCTARSDELLQVTGDANVPAGYISFVAFAHGVTSGRYDGREEVVGGLLMIRPTCAPPPERGPRSPRSPCDRLTCPSRAGPDLWFWLRLGARVQSRLLCARSQARSRARRPGRGGGAARADAYAEHGVPQVVNLAARRVAARFPALGQVNADPRVWRPELVPAQLLLYDGDAPRFSLLWDDAERPWRHLMDFRPVHVARRPPLQA